MDTGDTSPLLTNEEAATKEKREKEGDSQRLRSMVIFHGKELSNKSFRHSTQSNVVRIAIGREGVFKVDINVDKILSHWKFSDIKDWSYSGYSFTLQFKGRGLYHVRTDDGEAICSYIDAFQSDPDEALARALANPPDSRIPESGVRTLRRKFSGDVKVPPSPDVKFYTLSRRSTKNRSHDPTNRLAHNNVEVDSRLKSVYQSTGRGSLFQGPSDEGRHRAHSGTGLSREAGYKANGISSEDDKRHARDILSQTIEAAAQKDKEKENRLSNGIVMSPVSTKGETTKEASTMAAPSEVPSLPERQAAPQQVQQRALEQTESKKSEQPTTASESSSPVTKAEGKVSKESPKSVSTTSASQASPSSNPIEERPQPTNQIEQRRRSGSNPREVSPSDSESLGSDDMAPLLRATSSASSHSSTSTGLFSPTDNEFQFVPVCQTVGGVGDDRIPLTVPNKERPRSRDSQGSLSDDSNYDVDRLDKIQEEMKKLESVLSRSSSNSSGRSGPPSRRSHTYEDISLGQPSDVESYRYSGTITSRPMSPIYDHLSAVSPEKSSSPPLHAALKEKNLAGADLLSAPDDMSFRRIVSQPALSTPSSARASPSLMDASISPLIPEQSESEEETPTNSGDDQKAESGHPSDVSTVVVLRRKKRTAADPFADLLGTPQAVSRLRWSQELNPLYDYIRGIKISESISSTQDIKLYDFTPATRKSPGDYTPAKESPLTMKPPSVIIEEESEQEQTVSPKVNSVSPASPPPATERPNWVKPEKVYITAASCTLPRVRKAHTYEEIQALERPVSEINAEGMGRVIGGSVKQKARDSQVMFELKSATLATPVVRRIRSLENKQESVISPRLGKRPLQHQRRSRTVGCVDDTEAMRRKQKPMRVSDNMKDFSYVTREFRLFYIKMPNGNGWREVFNINKPVSELREKLCDLLGVDNLDNYSLHVEGAFLTTLKENDTAGESRVSRSTSIAHLMDVHSLPDQGPDPIELKPNLSLRMQGISTSRILSLKSDDRAADVYPVDLPTDVTNEFHKNWISVVQGNLPCTHEDAIKLAALQYQAYFLDRTAVHSVVGFCRPTEFLPVEYAGIRGIEQKMYKEQESLCLRSHKEIYEAYNDYCSKLPHHDYMFFPAREPRKKLLQSTKLKPVLFGVGSRGVMRVDPKTKEVLDTWDFQVLKNWAYSRRTFVLAFMNKNYPVESNQAQWLSELVDFHVDALVSSADALSQIISGSSQAKETPSS